MASKLGEFIESERRRKGISRSSLASMIGYRNVSKGARRVCNLERNGVGGKGLLAAVIAALDLDQNRVDELAETDHEAERIAFDEWADQPIEPHLIVKIGGACYRRELAPRVTSFEDGVEHLKQFCIERRTRACLVWSRRRRAWGRPDGSGWLEDVTPEHAVGPGMSLPGSTCRLAVKGS